MEELPKFRFHKDPLNAGNIKVSDEECDCCKRERGYILSAKKSHFKICPWCCASGEAAKSFGCFICAEEFLTSYSRDDADELEQRTPGIYTWQDWDWPAHCGEPAVFIEYAGYEEILRYEDEALNESLRVQLGHSEEEWPEYFQHIHKEGHCVAYIFECGKCGTTIGKCDFS